MNEIPNYVLYWPYVMAIMPYYDARNRTWTEVCYFDGTTEQYPCRCEYVVENLATAFHTTVELAKRRSARALEKVTKQIPRKVPLALAEGFCLVPIKCREERTRNTGTIGYVVLAYVECATAWPDGTSMVHFKNREVRRKVLQSVDTIRLQLDMAQTVRAACRQEKQYWEETVSHARNVLEYRISGKRKKGWRFRLISWDDYERGAYNHAYSEEREEEHEA